MTGAKAVSAGAVRGPAIRPAGLTAVELVWIEKQIEHWIRFGREVREQIVDRRRRVLFFPPGSVFALVRWASNSHGTVLSRLDILRAVGPAEACQTVPTVTPGGDTAHRLRIEMSGLCHNFRVRPARFDKAGDTLMPCIVQPGMLGLRPCPRTLEGAGDRADGDREDPRLVIPAGQG
jgi:hypothetical protein